MKLTQEQKLILVEWARHPGFEVAKLVMEDFRDILSEELANKQDEKDIILTAYKFKFGVQALKQFFNSIDNIAKSLDKDKGL